jgi:dephospho-CoA kinase
MKDFDKWAQNNQDKPYVINEAAILFESGYNSVADKIIVVICPEELRIKRIIERNSMTETEVRQRMKNQWSEERKTEHADFIIINDEVQLITPQVIEIDKQLKNINLLK